MRSAEWASHRCPHRSPGPAGKPTALGSRAAAYRPLAGPPPQMATRTRWGSPSLVMAADTWALASARHWQGDGQRTADGSAVGASHPGTAGAAGPDRDDLPFRRRTGGVRRGRRRLARAHGTRPRRGPPAGRGRRGGDHPGRPARGPGTGSRPDPYPPRPLTRHTSGAAPPGPAPCGPGRRGSLRGSWIEPESIRVRFCFRFPAWQALDAVSVLPWTASRVLPRGPPQRRPIPPRGRPGAVR